MSTTCEEACVLEPKGLHIGPSPSHLIASISRQFLRAFPLSARFHTCARGVEVRGWLFVSSFPLESRTLVSAIAYPSYSIQAS